MSLDRSDIEYTCTVQGIPEEGSTLTFGTHVYTIRAACEGETPTREVRYGEAKLVFLGPPIIAEFSHHVGGVPN